jgi:hypothetical protein
MLYIYAIYICYIYICYIYIYVCPGLYIQRFIPTKFFHSYPIQVQFSMFLMVRYQDYTIILDELKRPHCKLMGMMLRIRGIILHTQKKTPNSFVNYILQFTSIYQDLSQSNFVIIPINITLTTSGYIAINSIINYSHVRLAIIAIIAIIF